MKLSKGRHHLRRWWEDTSSFLWGPPDPGLFPSNNTRAGRWAVGGPRVQVRLPANADTPSSSSLSKPLPTEESSASCKYNYILQMVGAGYADLRIRITLPRLYSAQGARQTHAFVFKHKRSHIVTQPSILEKFIRTSIFNS